MCLRVVGYGVCVVVCGCGRIKRLHFMFVTRTTRTGKIQAISRTAKKQTSTCNVRTIGGGTKYNIDNIAKYIIFIYNIDIAKYPQVNKKPQELSTKSH